MVSTCQAPITLFNLNAYSVLFGTGASPYGFKLKWYASVGDTFVDATWAYTAP